MIIPGAEPFFFPGGRQGVLLIHGITGSPSEMKLLGEYLGRYGFSVLGVRLSGHGTSAEELDRTAWPHWQASVEDGYHLLRSTCDAVSAVGLSMGGLLTLKLASEYSLAKIAVLNTPIFLADKRLPMLPLLKVFRAFIPKRRRQFAVDPAYNICYDRWPLSSIKSLLELIQHVDGLLPQITTKALVMQSRHEHTVRPESAQHIFNRLGSVDKRLLWRDNSGHVITLDTGYEEVYEIITGFLKTDTD